MATPAIFRQGRIKPIANFRLSLSNSDVQSRACKSLPKIPSPCPSFNQQSLSQLSVEFPCESRHVEDWAMSLFDLYTSLEDESDLHRRRFWTLALKELSWHREVNVLGEHEYVVATIADPQNKTERYLRFDRTAAPTPIVQGCQFPKPRPSKRKLSISSFSTSSSCSSYSIESAISHQSTHSASSESSTGFSEHVQLTSPNDTVQVLDTFPSTNKGSVSHLLERIAFCHVSPPGSRSPTLFDLALAAKAVHDYRYHPYSHEDADGSWLPTILVRVLQNSGFGYSVKYRDPTAHFQHWSQPVVEDVAMAFRKKRARAMVKIKVSELYYFERVNIMSETRLQLDAAMALAAEASTTAANATDRARESSARVKEAEAMAEYEARLRAKAEERSERLMLEKLTKEKEINELRRRAEAAGLDINGFGSFFED